jgi:hypothetical protein
VREIQGVTPLFPATPPADSAAKWPVGLPWSIQPGAIVVVYDADPSMDPNNDLTTSYELFTNVEIVQVKSVNAGNRTFTADFNSGHTTYTVAGNRQPPRVKVLAYAQELQLIEQPDDYVVSPPNGTDGNPTRIRPVSVPGTLSGFPDRQAVVLQPLAIAAGKPTPGDFTGGYHFRGAANALRPYRPELWPVQPGDAIEVRGGGPMKQIVAVTTSRPPNQILNSGEFDGDIIVVESPFPIPIAETRDYRIVRAPRVLQSEPAIKLPGDVVIDLNTNFAYTGFPFAGPLPIDPATGNIDILFAPGGGLISRGIRSDRVNLWVRDGSQDTIDPKSGNATQFEQALVVAYRGTGFIAAFPVDTTLNQVGSPPYTRYANPYQFVQSGAHSGGL